jgi:hypothetical protein
MYYYAPPRPLAAGFCTNQIWDKNTVYMEKFQFLIRQLRDRIYNTSFKRQFQCFLLTFQPMIIILLIKKGSVDCRLCFTLNKFAFM